MGLMGAAIIPSLFYPLLANWRFVSVSFGFNPRWQAITNVQRCQMGGERVKCAAHMTRIGDWPRPAQLGSFLPIGMGLFRIWDTCFLPELNPFTEKRMIHGRTFTEFNFLV